MGRSAGTGESVKEAAQKTAHSRLYKTAADVDKENLLKGLREKFPDVYKELKKKMGRFNKGESMMSRLSWDQDKQMHKFTNEKGDVFWVDITNSPQDAFIIS